MDGVVIDLTYHASQLQVGAVDHAQRTGGDKVARNDTNRGMRHRRVGQTLAESGFDIQAQFAGSFLGAFQRSRIGNSQTVVKARFYVTQRQLFFDLRSGAVHNNHLDAKRMQQRQVLRQHRQGAGGDQFARKGDDKGLAAKGMDIGRDRAQPLYEFIGIFHAAHYKGK